MPKAPHSDKQLSVRKKESAAAPQAAQKSPDIYRTFFNLGGCGMVQISIANRRILLANRKMCEMHGYAEGELPGMKIMDLIPPGEHERANEEIARMLGGEVTEISAERQGLRKDGAIIWIQLSATVLRDETDRPCCMLAIVQEITGRKQAEEALQTEIKRWGVLFEQLPDGILLIDPKTARILDFNTAAHRMLGYSRKEFSTLSLFDVEAQESDEEIKKHVVSIMEHGKADFETQLRTRWGALRNIRVSAKAVDLQGESFYYVIWRDVTERKRVTEALSESQQRQKAILDSIPDPAWLKDKKGRFLAVNHAWSNFTGVPAQEAIGKTSFDLMPPENAQVIAWSDREVLQLNREICEEERFVNRQNEVVWFETVKAPIRNESGRAVETVGIARDITKRKIIEEALRKSESQLRVFFESDMIGAIFWNMDGKISDANEKFLSIVGYSREDLVVGRINWKQMTPPEYRPLDEAALAELKATGVDTPYEKEYVRKDGTRVPIIIGAAMLDEQRQVGIAFILDITERKRAEQALRENETRLSVIFNQSPLGIVLTRLSDGRIVDVNPAFANIHGYTPDELVGHNSSEMNLWAEPAQHEEMVEQVQAQGTCKNMEIKARKKNGEIRELHIFVEMIELGGEQFRLGITQDITERKRAEKELRLRTQELEARNEELAIRNKELDAFSHTVAHDIKSPLCLIYSIVDRFKQNHGLAAKGKGLESRELLEMLERHARKAINITDELLLLAQINKAKIHKGPLKMSEIVAQALERVAPLIRQQRAEVVLPECWPTALGYPAWIEEVWVNYLSNAFKYGGTPPRVELGTDVQADGTIRYWIRDNGPGIPREKLEQLFTPFTLYEEVDTAGYGMGLSIVRQIMDKLDGSAGAISTPELGSVFSFTLPGEKIRPEEARQIAEQYLVSVQQYPAAETLYLYLDPRTNSSFSVIPSQGHTLEGRLAAHRASWAMLTQYVEKRMQ